MAEDMYDAFPSGVIRTNFNELTGAHRAYNHQFFNFKMPCSDIQMNAIECVEAYGSIKGKKVCKMYMDDFEECMYRLKQRQRATEMKKERIRQVVRGERKIEDLDGKMKPKCDAFQDGPFVPA